MICVNRCIKNNRLDHTTPQKHPSIQSSSDGLQTDSKCRYRPRMIRVDQTKLRQDGVHRHKSIDRISKSRRNYHHTHFAFPSFPPYLSIYIYALCMYTLHTLFMQPNPTNLKSQKAAAVPLSHSPRCGSVPFPSPSSSMTRQNASISLTRHGRASCSWRARSDSLPSPLYLCVVCVYM